MISKSFLLCLTVYLAAVTAEVPEYIHVCGRRNPNFNDCVLKSIQSMTDELKQGIPELDIPALDPFLIDRLDLANMPSFTAYATNVSVYGISDYVMNYFNEDLDVFLADIDITFKELRMNSSFAVSAKILVNIEGKGTVYLTSKNLRALAKIQFKTVERHGKKYVYLESMTTKLVLTDYDVHFELDGNNKALHEALQTVLHDNHKELMEASTPNLERAVSEQVLKFGNKICMHFTYDELLPDRE